MRQDKQRRRNDKENVIIIEPKNRKFKAVVPGQSKEQSAKQRSYSHNEAGNNIDDIDLILSISRYRMQDIAGLGDSVSTVKNTPEEK